MAKNLAKSSFGLACERKRPASCSFPRGGGGCDGEEQERGQKSNAEGSKSRGRVSNPSRETGHHQSVVCVQYCYPSCHVPPHRG